MRSVGTGKLSVARGSLLEREQRRSGAWSSMHSHGGPWEREQMRSEPNAESGLRNEEWMIHHKGTKGTK